MQSFHQHQCDGHPDGVAALRLREDAAPDEAAANDAASAAQSEASVTPTARPYSEYRPDADVQKQLDASAAGTLMRPHLPKPPEVLAPMANSTWSGTSRHMPGCSECLSVPCLAAAC